jgi:hypothetical protein
MALEEKVSQDRYYRDDGENGVLCYLEDRDDTFRGYHTTSISDGSEHILLITNTYLYDNGGPYSFQFSPEEISAFLKATGAEKIEVFLDWV